MAITNKHIHNSKTKVDLRFIQTARDTQGRLLEMESTYNQHSKEPPAHYHPYQVEDFTVLAGELTVRIDGQIKVLKKGDTLHIPNNKVHSMWNNSDGKTIVNWKVQPTLDTEYLLEMFSGLANDSRTNNEGRPVLLQTVLMANRFHKEFRLANPPFIVQRVAFMLLTPIARLFGYRAVYHKYLD